MIKKLLFLNYYHFIITLVNKYCNEKNDFGLFLDLDHNWIVRILIHKLASGWRGSKNKLLHKSGSSHVLAGLYTILDQSNYVLEFQKGIDKNFLLYDLARGNWLIYSTPPCPP